MSSLLRLVRDDEERLSLLPELAPSSSRGVVVPFVALSVRAQENVRRRTEKLRILERLNPHCGAVVERLMDDFILKNGTQG